MRAYLRRIGYYSTMYWKSTPGFLGCSSCERAESCPCVPTFAGERAPLYKTNFLLIRIYVGAIGVWQRRPHSDSPQRIGAGEPEAVGLCIESRRAVFRRRITSCIFPIKKRREYDTTFGYLQSQSHTSRIPHHNVREKLYSKNGKVKNQKRLQDSQVHRL
ncbi:hypothetical protein Runsl_2902 [Runella slithyformis DSM 19594]|uniref:Uncharacterized protein n=1 Tax=Runella slithyformis (strain ATCC 29530 / DSM 19594 / LMG 11500 / NCIMB 11436 / LSU 4) TaxID=761193 RepID=A0A7U3ZL94_RUNSL|nr:hypothetical protein Runsl_2902 [Runella slithyformis DSM 19594]